MTIDNIHTQNYNQGSYAQNSHENEKINEEQSSTGNPYYLTLNKEENPIQISKVSTQNQFQICYIIFFHY